MQCWELSPLSQQGVWEACMCPVLWRGFARAGASSTVGSGPVPQSVTLLLRMQLSLEIEILSCPKPRLVHPSPLLSLLCLLPPQHLPGFEQHLR